MSSIFQIGEWWYLQWRSKGKQRQKALKTKEKWVAKRKQLAHDSGVSGSPVVEREALSLADVLARFLGHKQGTIAPDYHRRLRNYVMHLNGFFAGSVSALSSESVTEYQKERLSSGAASKSVKDEIIFLKSCLLWCVEEEMIPVCPVKRWPVIKVRMARPETVGPYGADDIAALIGYFSGKPFQDIFMACIFTGCRFGELVGLRVSDFFPAEMTLRVRSKKSEGAKEDTRILEVIPELAEILRRRSAGQFFFPEMITHGENWCRKQMKAACEALGIQYRRFHGLRHSFCTHLLDSGASIMDTREAMGHSSIVTTQKYLKYVPKKGQVARLPWAK